MPLLQKIGEYSYVTEELRFLILYLKVKFCFSSVQELQSEVAGLEESKDELLEHSEFVISLLTPQSKLVADETHKTVKELVEAYDK